MPHFKVTWETTIFASAIIEIDAEDVDDSKVIEEAINTLDCQEIDSHISSESDDIHYNLEMLE